MFEKHMDVQDSYILPELTVTVFDPCIMEILLIHPTGSLYQYETLYDTYIANALHEFHSENTTWFLSGLPCPRALRRFIVERDNPLTRSTVSILMS